MRWLVVILLSATGCTWQANQSSTAVEINPYNYGTGAPVIQPSNQPGYLDGQAVDMRSK